ncbi:MAG: hypothetical protein Q9181_003798 [Wetmoreana brouardii]
MPSAVPPPRASPLKIAYTHPNNLQRRSRSTIQHASATPTDELLSALLLGRKGAKDKSGQQKVQAMKKSQGSVAPTPKPTPLASQPSKALQAEKGSMGARGKKRKPQESLASPISRRRKKTTVGQANPKPPKDALPTPQKHKDLPPKAFMEPKRFLRNLLGETSTFSSEHSGDARIGFHCTLRCNLKGENIVRTTEGHGANMKIAEKAAYLRMAVNLKTTDTLKARMGIIEVDKVDNRVLKEERNSKLDIYNYAARFDATPEIHHRTLTGSHRMRGRRIHEVTVKLPEQNIEVIGRGAELKSAEIVAALRFKEAAEKYQAEHGDKSLFIKDSGALTTDNSSKFFEYYKIKHPDVSIELTRPLNNGETEERLVSLGIHRTQVKLNGELVGQAVSMSTRKQAEDLAFLTAALELKKKDPDLLLGFVRALATGNGNILRPVNSITMSVDEDCQLVMRETLLSARKAGLPDEAEEVFSDEDTATRIRAFRRPMSPRELKERTDFLERAFRQYLADPKLAELREKREGLPMNQYREQVLGLVSNNPYSIIVGATGSGKTTQVPQIVLDDAITKGAGGSCNIVCTQPRRIAATSVARRVADERAQQLQNSVGYQVRFDTKLPIHGGSITYCTTGVLLQQLQRQPDEVFDRISHLVIDEVHERDILVDFLLIILKRAMSDRVAAGKPTPKVVLMSATMDTELFASYFQTGIEGRALTACPSLSVPGRTFPVKERYLGDISSEMQNAHGQQAVRLLQQDPATKDYFKFEDEFRKQNPVLQKDATSDLSRPDEFVIDWKTERKVTAQGEATISTDRDDAIVPVGLVATTVAHITKTTDEGAILVFLPGLEEMVKVEELLNAQPLGVNFRDASKFKVYLLHSSQPAAQREVFDNVPQGCRKIILATNIAETSITIPDVQHVVDTGKLREKQYDQVRRITQLKCTWISKSNSKQRAGRAGRVQNGNYYALFSSERYNSLRAVGLPEMLRSDLQEICLDIKAQAFKYPIRQFLAEALEPPSPTSVDASIMNLQALDALTDEEQITPLGRLLASLPVHPSLGKMIVLGIIFRCLDPMLVLGAAAAERNIFVQPLENRRAAQAAKLGFVRGTGSDHMALLNAVREMRQMRDSKGEYAMRQFAFDNFIHANAFKTIDATAKQIEEILFDAGLIPFTPSHMRHNSEFGDPSLNENSSKVPLIKALTVAGYHPNLALSTGGLTHRTPGEAITLIHPSSVNQTAPKGRKDQGDNGNKKSYRDTLYAYSTMARSNDGNTIYLRDTTECTPLMATLFGGKLSIRNGNILEMDGWLPFFVRSDDKFTRFSQLAKTVLELRKALERLLAGAFMDLKISKTKTAGEHLGERGSILADEKVRAGFAEGLVEILDRDVKVRDEIARRGWKSESGAGVGRERDGAGNGKY